MLDYLQVNYRSVPATVWDVYKEDILKYIFYMKEVLDEYYCSIRLMPNVSLAIDTSRKSKLTGYVLTVREDTPPNLVTIFVEHLYQHACAKIIDKDDELDGKKISITSQMEKDFVEYIESIRETEKTHIHAEPAAKILSKLIKRSNNNFSNQDELRNNKDIQYSTGNSDDHAFGLYKLLPNKEYVVYCQGGNSHLNLSFEDWIHTSDRISDFTLQDEISFEENSYDPSISINISNLVSAQKENHRIFYQAICCILRGDYTTNHKNKTCKCFQASRIIEFDYDVVYNTVRHDKQNGVCHISNNCCDVNPNFQYKARNINLYALSSPSLLIRYSYAISNKNAFQNLNYFPISTGSFCPDSSMKETIDINTFNDAKGFTWSGQNEIHPTLHTHFRKPDDIEESIIFKNMARYEFVELESVITTEMDGCLFAVAGVSHERMDHEFFLNFTRHNKDTDFVAVSSKSEVAIAVISHADELCDMLIGKNLNDIYTCDRYVVYLNVGCVRLLSLIIRHKDYKDIELPKHCESR